MNILELPDDVFLLIFAQLDLKERAECELTCVRWRNLIHCASVPPIFLRVRQATNDNFKLYPRTPLASGELLKRQWEMYSVNSGCAQSFLKKHKLGKELLLHVSDESSLEGCLNVVEEEWLNLKDLQIEFGDPDTFAECFTHLTDMRIVKYITHIKSPYLSLDFKPSENCPNIKGLHLGHITSGELRCLPGFGQLRTFYGLNLDLNEDCDWFIANMSHLQELAFSLCNTDSLEKICHKMRHLTSLSFDTGQLSENVVCLGQLKNLRNLSFTSSSSEKSIGVVEAVKKCSTLKTLAVMCTSPSFIVHIPYCIPQLEVLEIFLGHFENPLEDFNGLAVLATMKRLRTLNISTKEYVYYALYKFIKRSSTIRNVDAKCVRVEEQVEHIVRIFNQKAAENPHEQFRLCIHLPQENVGNLPANLKLYYKHVSGPGSLFDRLVIFNY